MNNQFSNLLSPIKIRNKVVKNRIIMSPMDENMANPDGTITDEYIAYYEERAKGGVGIIMTGMVSVDYESGRASTHQATVVDNKQMIRFKKLTDRIHKYNALLIPQISHCGWETDKGSNGGNTIKVVSYGTIPKVINKFSAKAVGKQPLTESEISVFTTEELENQIKNYANTALLMKEAGCDGVEVHGAHYYLIAQLLSKLMNRRKDKFGGSFNNRTRFVREVVKSIREKCGEDFIIAVRIAAEDYMTLGLGLNSKQSLELARMLQNAGADLIDITCGLDPQFKNSAVVEPQGFKEGFRSGLAKKFKEALDIPVTTVGVLRTPEFCENLIRNSTTDFVTIGRGLIADPYWVQKVMDNKNDEIRKCISCNEGCIASITKGLNVPIRCTVNPNAGKENESKIKTEVSKKIVIIGGGPAGMQAAITAKEIGHDVTLLEKTNKLGGQLNLALVPPDKEFIKWTLEWYINRIEVLDIDVRFNVSSISEKIKKISPDEIIVATGSEPFVPPIKGINQTDSAWEILKGNLNIRNERIAIIGGGLVGTETALYLSKLGNRVTIIEMADEIVKGLEPISRNHLMNNVKDNKIKIMTNTKVTEITESYVSIAHKNKSKKISASKVITAVGQRSVGMNIYEELKDLGYNPYVIGDANKVGKIINAVEEGYEIYKRI